ncbi:Threonine/homoserine/homoserine lactone efflux protein [Pseudomonas asplenii]|uniref:Threonine/homoserine/homoserine lactone efflux protein n=1 Tax=Pseudomonas asplenii TaxID=53407 RepID=A0A1H1Y624_9PSED|nr:LysE family transporter [Pseudomonas asplenii]SDT16968.1 Threonine/homoserine/homoserine lactone efflux protein [Pseudomonas asplenii]
MYYVAIAILTILLIPGPTNSLLLQSGVSRGLGNYSLKLIFAEWIAYLLQITSWGLFIDGLAQDYAWVVVLTKIAAVLFLFYISLKLWFSVQLEASGEPSVISVSAMFMATLTNPKGLFFASFVAPVGTFVQVESYLEFMAVFSLVILPVGLVWVGLGAFCGRNFSTILSGNRVNKFVSLVIGLFASVALYNLASNVILA